MTLGVLCQYLHTRRDYSISRRKRRKARVAWLLLRRKRYHWHCKGEWPVINQRQREQRARLRELERLRFQLEQLRALMPLRVSA